MQPGGLALLEVAPHVDERLGAGHLDHVETGRAARPLGAPRRRGTSAAPRAGHSGGAQRAGAALAGRSLARQPVGRGGSVDRVAARRPVAGARRSAVSTGPGRNDGAVAAGGTRPEDPHVARWPSPGAGRPTPMGAALDAGRPRSDAAAGRASPRAGPPAPAPGVGLGGGRRLGGARSPARAASSAGGRWRWVVAGALAGGRLAWATASWRPSPAWRPSAAFVAGLAALLRRRRLRLGRLPWRRPSPWRRLRLGRLRGRPCRRAAALRSAARSAASARRAWSAACLAALALARSAARFLAVGRLLLGGRRLGPLGRRRARAPCGPPRPRPRARGGPPRPPSPWPGGPRRARPRRRPCAAALRIASLARSRSLAAREVAVPGRVVGTEPDGDGGPLRRAALGAGSARPAAGAAGGARRRVGGRDVAELTRLARSAATTVPVGVVEVEPQHLVAVAVPVAEPHGPPTVGELAGASSRRRTPPATAARSGRPGCAGSTRRSGAPTGPSRARRSGMRCTLAITCARSANTGAANRSTHSASTPAALATSATERPCRRRAWISLHRQRALDPRRARGLGLLEALRLGLGLLGPQLLDRLGQRPRRR